MQVSRIAPDSLGQNAYPVSLVFSLVIVTYHPQHSLVRFTLEKM